MAKFMPNAHWEICLKTLGDPVRQTESALATLWGKFSATLKGTHARDFHSLFLIFFCIFQLLIQTNHSTTSIFENLLQIRQDIRNFLSVLIFTERALHY
jgi:hypothetical protein